MTLPRLASRLAKTMTPADIPTLSQLYRHDHTNALNPTKPKYEFTKQLNDRVSIWRGDITKLEVGVLNQSRLVTSPTLRLYRPT